VIDTATNVILSAPYIDNPAYKGVWAPKKIKNPNYYEDKTPANLEPMGAIGFEIWTMQNDILFDNIYIGHSVEDAEKFAQETFFEKHPIEQLLELETKPKDDDKPPRSPSDLVFKDDPIFYIKEKLDLFFTIAQNDPIQAIKFVPEAAGGLAAAFVTIILLIVGLVSLSGSPAPPQVKKAAEKGKAAATDAKNKVAEAVSTGAENAKAEVNKRTTRSTS
jgi:calnexin